MSPKSLPKLLKNEKKQSLDFPNGILPKLTRKEFPANKFPDLSKKELELLNESQNPISDLNPLFVLLSIQISQSIPSDEDLWKKAELELLKAEIKNILENLPAIERQVLEMKFGLNEDKPLTFKEIGQKINLSGERVRQIEAKILRDLRKPATRNRLKPFVDFFR